MVLLSLPTTASGQSGSLAEPTDFIISSRRPARAQPPFTCGYLLRVSVAGICWPGISKFARAAGPPEGVGRLGTPPMAPAVGNALFVLTGQRLRSLPLKRVGTATGGL